MGLEVILIPLIITLIVEPLFFVIIGYRTKRFLIICLLINFITNLTLTLIMGLSYLEQLRYQWWHTLVLETMIVFIEGLVYYMNDHKRIGFVWSLCANIISFSLGLFIYYLIYGRIYL